MNHPVTDGGQGYDLFQQMLIEEQWGRATGALWDLPWRPAIPLSHAGPSHRRTATCVRPSRGERRDAYAIAEEHAGSDPTMVRDDRTAATAAAGSSTGRSGT